MGPPEDILRVEEVHRAGRGTTNSRAGRAKLRRQRVSAEALEAAVEDDVRVQVFQGLEASLTEVIRSTFAADALNSLEAVQVIAVGVVIRNDKVRAVITTDKEGIQRIHLLKDGAGTQRGRTVRRGRPSLVLPKRPLRPVNTADNTRSGGRRDKELEAANGVRHRTVTINALREAVHEGRFSVLNPALEEIDDRLFTRVLELFQPADADGNRRLTDRIFSRAKYLRRTDVQGLITTIGLLSLACL